MIEAEPASPVKNSVFTTQELGARLRQIRVMRKMSLVQLSKISSISVAMLSHIERGHSTPSLNTLQHVTCH